MYTRGYAAAIHYLVQLAAPPNLAHACFHTGTFILIVVSSNWMAEKYMQPRWIRTPFPTGALFRTPVGSDRVQERN
jgi:hypothetical protein